MLYPLKIPILTTALWPLIDVKISIFRNNEWILIKLCLCIDIYYDHVVTNTHYLPKLFNRVMSLDLILELCLCSIFCEIIDRFDQIW